jgi:transcriptional regulator with XRE-family HTH domain
MNLYLYDIGEKARKASRFIGQVRAELQKAFAFEKASRKITQQQVATMIGVNRSVINRQLMGLENLTLRRVAELAWALGWEIVFYLRKPQATLGINILEPKDTAQTPPVAKVAGTSIPQELDAFRKQFQTAA